jgi:hypothetical protein
MGETIQALIASELERLPEKGRLALEQFLVQPYKVMRHNDYNDELAECWIIAVSQRAMIAYCENGISNCYCWGIIDPKSTLLGRDDGWHLSLDDAFMNSGLCDRDLIPQDYEVL